MQDRIAAALVGVKGILAKLDARDRELFELRLTRSFADLYRPMQVLYGHLPDFETHVDAMVRRLAEAAVKRPPRLRSLDLAADLEPDWFLRPDQVGYVFYIDRFAGNLKGVLKKLDYLEELGVTYVHFMPCLMPRPGDSDGGYSVMDYKKINPDYGSMKDFETVAEKLAERGIRVCIDLVLNHTAKEHEWANKARAGSEQHRAYYWMFEDRTWPDQYEQTLVEIFPEHAPGNFTWYDDLQKWVWTTFNEHQWDLNWTNPAVMGEIVDIMLFLANKGVSILRLDAVAFMWKRLGTRCQNEPEVHQILHALKAANRIAAPSVLHKEEAIVAPTDLIPYLGVGEHTGKEGNLAYHNTLMVQFWSALATRSTGLMTHVLRTHFPTRFENASFATYIRCHDDIGWAITDEDAGAVGLSGGAHRRFLADFYTGAFPGSFARGRLFQDNPATGDRRNSGTSAALAGLESALEHKDAQARDHAVQRLLLGHALIASFGGLPLLYMGDELGLLNDESYLKDPHRAHDSRWMHRPMMDWKLADARADQSHPAGQIFSGTRHILMRRKAVAAFHAANPTEILDTGRDGLFAFRRVSPTETVLGIFNFTEQWLSLPRDWASAMGARHFHDHLGDAAVETPDGQIALPPYARLWLG